MNPGALVRERRLANRLTQAQLARRASTTQPAISRIERGEVSPSFETVERLLAAMGEEGAVGASRMQSDIDPRRLTALRARPPGERLALAISWNRLAGEFAAAGRAARARSQ